MKRVLTALVLALALTGCGPSRQDVVVVGSKNFPEQLILGELIAQQIEARTHLKVQRRFYLAGTYICQQAMLAGRIDVYPEYTGTALTAILKEPPLKEPGAVYNKIKQEYQRKFHFAVLPSFGFNDTFAIEIRGADARRLHLTTISQAAKYTPQWRPGFGYEFMERPDGYKGLVSTYGLKFAAAPQIMDLGLLDRALVNKQIDLAAGNSTDGLIPVLDLAVLEDDKHYFPPYDAVPIVREEVLAHHPGLRAALAELAGKVSDQDMRALNYAVDGQHRSVTDVVREFRQKKGLN
jgi:osmoprotectant transport system substrate-binding protein